MITDELERHINTLITCAPLQCRYESACFCVGKFAREQIRQHRLQEIERARKEEESLVEQYAISQLYAAAGGWEAA